MEEIVSNRLKAYFLSVIIHKNNCWYFNYQLVISNYFHYDTILISRRRIFIKLGIIFNFYIKIVSN